MTASDQPAMSTKKAKGKKPPTQPPQPQPQPQQPQQPASDGKDAAGSAQTDKYKGVHLFVGTPCYGSQVYVQFMICMDKLKDECRKRGVQIHFQAIPGVSLVPLARNMLVSLFLSQPQYTHLLFLDADIAFSPEAVFLLLEPNLPIVGGVYPKKDLKMTKVREMAKTVADTVPNNIFTAMTLDYVVNFKASDKHDRNVEILTRDEQQLCRVAHIGAGFLLLQRQVFDKLRLAFPERKHLPYATAEKEPENLPAYKDSFYDFFACQIDPETRMYLGEDYGFCHLCDKAGIPIYASMRICLTHIGLFQFPGMFNYYATSNMTIPAVLPS